ncbi:MAG TPA: nitrophenyl compound nitroreductase subunit ArsF family protein [Elusimicrobiota bacterium]|nr:nitrophenyl compound nitroreductase subunit ArsF family protein [Elusimicrobiota bacterium]
MKGTFAMKPLGISTRLNRIVLLLLLGMFPLASFSADGPSPVPQKPRPTASDPHKLLVYYFHGNARCMTCRKFESYTKAIMETHFADDTRRGRLEYRVVNVDETGNEHFIRDYGLYTKSVVLSDTRDGQQVRWKNLDKIWEKVRNEAEYKRYIEEEVRSFLEKT